MNTTLTPISQHHKKTALHDEFKTSPYTRSNPHKMTPAQAQTTKEMYVLTDEEVETRFGEDGTVTSPAAGVSCTSFITLSSVRINVSHVALSSAVASFSF